MWGRPPGSWRLHLSDAWFYTRHPLLFWEEVALHWLAERRGQVIRWM